MTIGSPNPNEEEEVSEEGVEEEYGGKEEEEEEYVGKEEEEEEYGGKEEEEEVYLMGGVGQDREGEEEQ